MCIWKVVTDSASSFILKWNNNKTRKKLYENKSENKYRYTLKWTGRGGGGGGERKKERKKKSILCKLHISECNDCGCP